MNFEQMEELRALQSNKFLKAVEEKYGIKPGAMKTLLDDYGLYPRGSMGPCDDDPAPYSIKEIAEKFGLTQDVIYRFQDDFVISEAPTYRDLDVLERIRRFWGKAFFLKKQIAKLSKQQREELITRPELATKWEKWIYTIYLKNEIAFGIGGHMIDPSQRIKVEYLAETIESMFGIPNCYNLQQRIKKIREIAYNDKKKVKNQRTTVESLCISRGVPLNRVHLEIGEKEEVMYS
jgi:hypothetical protein